MNQARLLTNAYFEALYEVLVSNKDKLISQMQGLLRAQIGTGSFADWHESKFSAYLEACIAFLDERIETYDPVGIQYTFDHISDAESLELEFALSWYDGRAEYKRLIQVAWEKTQTDMLEDRVGEVAAEIIQELGAYPDRSIIAGYEERPTLNKLPDYVVAQVIEHNIVHAG